MSDRGSSSFERFGALAGLAAIALLVALFMVVPSVPPPDRSPAEITAKVAANKTALLLGGYLGTLMTGALVVFGTAVAVRIRRGGTAAEGWWLLALAGIAASSVGIAGNALELMFVRSVGHGVTGASIWLGYGGDHWASTLLGVPLSVFLVGAGSGIRAGRTLPRWLGSLGLVVGALLVVGAASVVGDEVDGGVLGIPLVLGYLGLVIWIAGVSTAMLRSKEAVFEPALSLG
jgi:hypothetical protein